jgi:hypothetical protein
MTRDEVKNALPEMVLFAKTEEERAHFKKLQATMDSSQEMEAEVKEFVSTNSKKVRDNNEYKASFKTRRS